MMSTRWSLTRAFSAARQLQAQLLGSTSRRAVAANSGWLLFDKLARAALGLLVGAWVARYLGPAQFGVLAYVTAFIALFSAVANLSADAIVVRDIAQEPDEAPAILGSTLILRVVLGMVCWAVAIGCVALTNPGNSRIILMAAIVGSVLVFQAADTVDLWFQSHSQSRRTVVAKLVAYFISNGIKVVLILTGAPLVAFAAVAAFDALACAAGLFVAYRGLRTSRPWTCTRHRVRRILGDVWPFMLSGVSIMVYSRIDQIMIRQILGDNALGIYAAALPLSQFWQVIPVTLSISLAPVVARRKLESEDKYQRTLVHIFRAFFFLAVACAVFTWLISGFLVHLLFGPTFAEAARVLDLHVISNIFLFMGVAHSLWLVNERRFAVRLWGTVLAGAATVLLNLVLLPHLGVAGAAITAIAAQFIAAVLINVFLDPKSFRMQCAALFLIKA